MSATFILESYNFIIFFISWELFNLSLYIMIIGNGVKEQESLAASLKYFLLSAFSTAFLL
jgi:NADH:ubiquinone oxidoreductase subunit 2 (subunit N)